MIVFTVMYPNGPGKHFDMDYYLTKHMALVREKIGDALKGVTVDKGVSAGAAGPTAPYAAITRLMLGSMDDLATYMAPHSPEFDADLPNFTDITPFIQVSEVAM